MLAKHPKTLFVHAHVAMMVFDLKRTGELLDKFPNSDVEISAAVQDLGRPPYSRREFMIKYQDRILFGTYGNPSREVEEFWTPHFRYLETNDEYFNHPAQLGGRWERSCTAVSRSLGICCGTATRASSALSSGRM